MSNYVFLPEPDIVEHSSGYIIRTYRLGEEVEFGVLWSRYPGQERTCASSGTPDPVDLEEYREHPNRVVATDLLEGMFSGEQAMSLQQRLEEENVLKGLNVSIVEEDIFAAKRILRFPAEEFAKVFAALKSIGWAEK